MSKTNNFWIIISASVLTLILYIVPFLHPIAYPFMLLSTLVHEMGHGMAAALVGGHFNSFQMWPDGSGAANISGDFGRFSRAFVAFAGLVGPALTASLFFLGINSPKRSRMALGIFAIVLLLATILVVRNWFGVGFVVVLALLSLYFSLGGGQKHAQLVLSFFAAQLSLSVFSRSDYLFTSVAQTSMGNMPSDVAQIADALFLPYWLWGGLIGLFSVGVLLAGFKRVFKKP